MTVRLLMEILAKKKKKKLEMFANSDSDIDTA